MKYFQVVVSIRGRAFRYEAHAPTGREARRLTAERHGCPIHAAVIIHRGPAVLRVTAEAHFIERPRRLSAPSEDDSASHASTSAAQRSRSRLAKRERVANARPSAQDVHNVVARIPEFASMAGNELPVWVMRGDPYQPHFMVHQNS